MKISLNWLKDYMTLEVSTDELANKLTMAGFEVEDIRSIDGETILELEITPNRADCLNMIGMAREISAIFNKTLKLPNVKRVKFPNEKIAVKIEDKQGCQRYIGTLIQGIVIEQAPQRIKNRILSLGMRSINNVVDVINFCLIEGGQPLHAFDFDKLTGEKIVVRRAKQGEKIITIDGVQRELEPSILVIADESGPIAIAGIMGGKATEITHTTKNILLESAYFDPVLIRRASRQLGLTSDSSYRFERGVDYSGVKTGSDRVVSLILDLAKGKIAKQTDLEVKKGTKQRQRIDISIGHINFYLGSRFSLARCKIILQRLGCSVILRGKDKLQINTPSFRPDIKREVDIIEEIARIVGYDKLPSSIVNVKPSFIPLDQKRRLGVKLRDSLVSQGFNEIITYSMVRESDLKRIGHKSEELKIVNPLSKDQEFMRPSLLSNFLNVVYFNLNRGQKRIKFFEIGKVYSQKGEFDVMGFIMVGQMTVDWQQVNKARPISFYDMKGVLTQTLTSYLGKIDFGFKIFQDIFFREGWAASVHFMNNMIGQIGLVNQDILDHFDIKERNIYYAQIDLEKLYTYFQAPRLFKAIPSYPVIVRDISFVIDKKISYEKLLRTIHSFSSEILLEIILKEDYTDFILEKLPKGHKGILISVVYQASDRTLLEEEVNTEHNKIIQLLKDQLGVVIR